MSPLDIESADVPLLHVTHDTRRIMNDVGMSQPVRLFHAVLLMQSAFNHGANLVAACIKNAANQDPGLPAHNMIAQALHGIERRKKFNNAVFTPEAMLNLYKLDQLVVTSDYTVRLDNLADVLGRLDDEDMEQIIVSTERCGMNLLLIKIEDYVGNRDTQRAEGMRVAQYRMQEVKPTAPQTRELLQQTIDDLRLLKEK
jgi:hypothetical protein